MDIDCPRNRAVCGRQRAGDRTRPQEPCIIAVCYHLPSNQKGQEDARDGRADLPVSCPAKAVGVAIFSASRSGGCFMPDRPYPPVTSGSGDFFRPNPNEEPKSRVVLYAANTATIVSSSFAQPSVSTAVPLRAL